MLVDLDDADPPVELEDLGEAGTSPNFLPAMPAS